MARKKTSPTADDIQELLDEAEDISSLDASGPSALTDREEADWIKSSGWTPVEFLTHTYRNPYQRMSDRINAAKAVLDYAHRKLPQKIEVDASVAGRALTLDAAVLSKLSIKELESLEVILAKVAP